MATQVLASLGTAAGIALALSPVPTMRTILNSKSIGDFTVFPYIVTFCQSSLWGTYAIVTPGKLSLVPVNALVAGLELVYCVIFFLFAADRETLLKSIGYPLGITILFIMLSLISPSPSKFIGFFAVIANIVMYAAPLAVVKTVVETRSVKYMPFLLSFIGFISSLIWTSWALAADDQFVLVPNVLGAVLGAIQLAVYFKYRDKGTDSPSLPTRAAEESSPSVGERNSLIN
jgi:solute carrier family 50 protein (sugar transporter)